MRVAMSRCNRRSRISETWFPALLLAVALGCRSSGRSDADAVAQSAAQPLTLQHATLINPGARPLPDATVLVRNGRIICAGTATACPRLTGSKAIDLTG